MEKLTKKELFAQKRAKAHRAGNELVRVKKDLEGGSHSFIYFEKIALDLCSKFNKKINVLDIGCGTGKYFCTFRNVNLLVGLDMDRFRLHEAKDPYSAEVVKKHTKKVQLVRGDFTTPLFKDETFDLIWSIAAIRYWKNLGRAGFNQWTKWLRPGGRIYFMWRTPKTHSTSQIRKEFSNIVPESALKDGTYHINKIRGPKRKLRLDDPYFTTFNGVRDK